MNTSTYHPNAFVPPRMQDVYDVLEGAKDVGDLLVIAACRRCIEADRFGWSERVTRADVDLVMMFADEINA